ncbi:hypothetical protein AAVH_33579 [Aphelenchoides avenae]|nr:hypothetical protein AAVH_33579 [Aphelenchus avenae]
MSSIQTAPVEVLLDMFQANDPAGTEALQLTCRRFHDTILQNVDALPTRLVCELAYGVIPHQVRLYRTPPNNENDQGWDVERESIASSYWGTPELEDMYEKFGGKTAIRKVDICVNRNSEGADGLLTRLIENFPSVKGAVSLDVFIKTDWVNLPTDPVLDRFWRLEMITMRTRIYDNDPYFWRGLFAKKAFRRVSKLRMLNALGQYPAVDDGELFDFITDFSRMPADTPRVIQFAQLGGDSLGALERQFNENIGSIGGHVCAVISAPRSQKFSYLTNMAVGDQKKTLAQKLLRDA